MPETVQYSVVARVNDLVTYENVQSVAGNSIEQASPTVPAAKVGQLTTRTDADTGVLTMVAGHGFATSDKVDVYWAGGSRRDMTATVATNAVTVDGGSGDDLPTNLAAVTAMVPISVPFVVNGDALKSLVAYSPVPGWVVWFDNANTPVAIAAATYAVDRAESGVWATGAGVANPLASKTTSAAKFSHGSTTAQVLKAVAVFGG